MAKNIVLCSDGTGNAGGKGQGTNVWRIYHAIDRNRTTPEQVTFYDDGVGTEENKYLKMFGGAVGWGFTRNVKELYKFLAKNYADGDDIYMFGFSRGAYTVRALAAFVSACGVIDTARTMTEKKLGDDIKRLVRMYGRRGDKQQRIDVDEIQVTRPKIKCVGVWDTVSAIGMPFDILLKDLILHRFPFHLRDNELSSNVEYGFHALAVDDERLTFHPEKWNDRKNIEQVWFAGMHSNVGGGYPKQGMAYVALDWMMEKVAYDSARGWGLHFEQGLRDEARHHANVHDKLYDSRSGAGAYYRLSARDIEALTPGSGAVMIHDSVFDRIKAKTLAYNPGNIPSGRDIKVVTTAGTPPNSARQARCNSTKTQRGKILKGARKWINARKGLHLTFILVSMLLATAAGTLALTQFFPDSAPALYAVPALFTLVTGVIMGGMRALRYWVLCLLALAILALFLSAPQPWFGGPVDVPDLVREILLFLLPDLLANLIVKFIAQYPYGALAIVVAAVVMAILKGRFRRKAAAVFEQACNTLR